MAVDLIKSYEKHAVVDLKKTARDLSSAEDKVRFVGGAVILIVMMNIIGWAMLLAFTNHRTPEMSMKTWAYTATYGVSLAAVFVASAIVTWKERGKISKAKKVFAELDRVWEEIDPLNEENVINLPKVITTKQVWDNLAMMARRVLFYEGLIEYLINPSSFSNHIDRVTAKIGLDKARNVFDKAHSHLWLFDLSCQDSKQRSFDAAKKIRILL